MHGRLHGSGSIPTMQSALQARLGCAPGLAGRRRLAVPPRPPLVARRPGSARRAASIVNQAAGNGSTKPVTVNSRGLVVSGPPVCCRPLAPCLHAARAPGRHQTRLQAAPARQRPANLGSGRRRRRDLAAAAACALRPASMFAPHQVDGDTETPFKKLMAANRGEIAVRITRAGIELGLQTVRLPTVGRVAPGAGGLSGAAGMWRMCRGRPGHARRRGCAPAALLRRQAGDWRDRQAGTAVCTAALARRSAGPAG